MPIQHIQTTDTIQPMRSKSLLPGLRSAVLCLFFMGALSGCSWLHDYFPADSHSLPNADAINRALRLCALTHGETSFHLKMQISPADRASSLPPAISAMQAEIELWWINASTYRVEIRSANFRQTRIVNGPIVDEQNIGIFYPRWIENFVDALFKPVPDAEELSLEPGSVPVSEETHACVRHEGSIRDETATAQICFQGKEPLIASGISFNRYVAFDNFATFGTQLIPRTFINDLPANTLLRGEILILEPLPQSAYPLLKATHATPLIQQIRTQLVSRSEAEAMLLASPPAATSPGADASSAYQNPATTASSLKRLASYPSDENNRPRPGAPESDPVIVYVRTDLTGRVREAYTDRSDIYNQHQHAVAQAMQLHFRPLLVDGALVQMEAPVEIR